VSECYNNVNDWFDRQGFVIIFSTGSAMHVYTYNLNTDRIFIFYPWFSPGTPWSITLAAG
jgi:hypothetical protein